MSILSFFRSGNYDEAFKPPQGQLRDLPSHFTLDELSAELLTLLLESSKNMALLVFANRAMSTDEQNHVIRECLGFHLWYLERMIGGRTMILKRLDHGFRHFIWEFRAFRGHVEEYESASRSRHQQYNSVFRESGKGATFSDEVTPSLLQNILNDDALCGSAASLPDGVTDCIQTFARLVFQALSVPMTYGFRTRA